MHLYPRIDWLRMVLLEKLSRYKQTSGMRAEKFPVLSGQCLWFHWFHARNWCFAEQWCRWKFHAWCLIVFEIFWHKKKGLFNDQTSVDVVGHFQLATIKTKKRLNRYTLCLRLTGMTNISSSFWLVVSTPLRNMSMGRIIPNIWWNIKNVWNHQPAFQLSLIPLMSPEGDTGWDRSNHWRQ